MSDHIHWSGTATDVIPYGTQNLTVGFSTDPQDPIGTVVISGAGATAGQYVRLPNSVKGNLWEEIPGTNPRLQARQDGHFPNTLILIRPAV